MTKTKLPLATIRKIMTENNQVPCQIGIAAVEPLEAHIRNEIIEITNVATLLSVHSKRKRVSDGDIRLAIKARTRT